MSEPKQQDKPFQIDKIVVWEAFQRVKANKGAAGVDEQSIQAQVPKTAYSELAE